MHLRIVEDEVLVCAFVLISNATHIHAHSHVDVPVYPHSNKFCIYPNSFSPATSSQQHTVQLFLQLGNSDLYLFVQKVLFQHSMANHNKEKTSIEIMFVQVEKRQQQKFLLFVFYLREIPVHSKYFMQVYNSSNSL